MSMPKRLELAMVIDGLFLASLSIFPAVRWAPRKAFVIKGTVPQAPMDAFFMLLKN